MNLEEEIKQSILAVLPTTSMEAAEGIANLLVNEGVTEMNMLKYVTAEDLSRKENLHHLSLFPARKLIAHWQALGEDPPPTAQVRHQPVLAESHSMQQFTVNWEKIPTKVLEKLNKDELLTKAEADQLVILIVDDVRAKVPSVNRSFFKGVAENMRKKYTGRVLQEYKKESGDGTDIILPFRLEYKFKNRLDNVKRNPNKTQMEIEAPAIPQAYGCIKWQLLQPPEGEDESSLQQKQEQLKDMFQLHRRDYDWEKILELSKATYFLQRKDINSQTSRNKNFKRLSTEEIQDNWPFLFTYKGVSSHFRILTGVHFENKIGSFVNISSQNIIDFLAKKSQLCEKIRAQFQNALKRKTCKDPELTAIVLMVCAALKEDESILIKCVQAGNTRAEVKETCVIPDTPCIFACGMTAFRASKFYVSLDGEIRFTTRSFGQALVTFMGSYFVFNIRYPDRANNTLDFIQRMVLEINPPQGTKRPKGKSQAAESGPISFRLQVLIKSFKKYEASLPVDNGSNEDDPPPGDDMDED